ncbi:MAG: FAD-binding protein, partial [Acidobacteria bacterium]|nr:FAD-binding protein [Acidobacteriota bacterium]
MDNVEVAGRLIPVFSVNTLIIGSGAAALNAAVQLAALGQKDICIVTDCWGGGTSNNAGSDKQTYYKLSLAGDIPDSARAMAEDLYKAGLRHGDIALCEAQKVVRKIEDSLPEKVSIHPGWVE